MDSRRALSIPFRSKSEGSAADGYAETSQGVSSSRVRRSSSPAKYVSRASRNSVSPGLAAVRQIGLRLGERADAVPLRHRALSETPELREDEPHPVALFLARA